MAKYIIAYVLSCILFCYFSYDYGMSKGNLQAVITKKEVLEESNKVLLTYKNEIERLNKEQYKFKQDKENEIFNINRKYNTIINGLRQRPERPVVTETITKIEPAICTGNGSTGQQLFREDAEFLIRQAQLAEVLKQSLIECRKN